MNLKEARFLFSSELKDFFDPGEAMNITDLVLEHVKGYTKIQQIKKNGSVLTEEQIIKLSKISDRLKLNEPVQYILGEAWFAGLKLKVNKNVLIPRPETEELVAWVLADIPLESEEFKIIDIGTGSGCIPISIKKKLPQASVHAIDVCSEAIFTATENAATQKTEIEFILFDILEENKWNELGEYDVIVSNPPYVRLKEKESMMDRVLNHEPHLALFVPDNDALIFYHKLADFSKTHLKTGGALYAEINEGFGKDVLKLLQSKGFNKTEQRKDMQGKERMIKAEVSYEF
jgi:release factor glutamine methyltransferase